MKKRVPLNWSRESKHSKCTLLCTRFLTMGVLSVCFSGQDPVLFNGMAQMTIGLQNGWSLLEEEEALLNIIKPIYS